MDTLHFFCLTRTIAFVCAGDGNGSSSSQSSGNTPPSESSGGAGSLSPGEVVGIVAGCVAGAIIFAGALVACATWRGERVHAREKAACAQAMGEGMGRGFARSQPT